jgi:hypothetical protein
MNGLFVTVVAIKPARASGKPVRFPKTLREMLSVAFNADGNIASVKEGESRVLASYAR